MWLTRSLSGLAVLVLATGAIRLSAQPAPQATDLATFVVSAPVTLRDLGKAQIRGIPTRMAWSPDGAWLYLRLSTVDRWSNETVRHVLVETAGNAAQDLSDEPGWLARYWNLKSALTSPSLASWRIKIDTRDEQVRTTNVPREGNIGQHGDPGAGLDEVIRKAANSSQKVLFEDYVLNGKVISSSINGHVPPGRMFAWAPTPLSLIAFVDAKGRLVLMNQAGVTREVKGVKKAALPAWSEDGRRLAFVQSTGSSNPVVKVVDIR
jgi:hypothetical protein